ncbi:hypothetical protein NSP_35660 [Nodularia spumigena CCY9414]|nr:hypothetical protein NSP_35660 [Nodularia spumigena CCY9414]
MLSKPHPVSLVSQDRERFCHTQKLINEQWAKSKNLPKWQPYSD